MGARLQNNPRPLWDLTQEVAPGFVRLKHHGRTVGYVLWASHYDEEDIGYMTDAEFWKMINKHRKSEKPGIPLEKLMAQIAGREEAEREAKKANSQKKDKRNGSLRSK